MGNIPTRRSKVAFFALEALNSVAVGLYYTYLFWFMQERFGYGDRENLAVAALNGLIYTFCAWQGGRLGQRLGYLPTLLLGSAAMSLCLAAALVVDGSSFTRNISGWQVLVLSIWTLGVSVTWPALEAMVTDGEEPKELPRMVGRYNVTWASGWAVAYFGGGAMLEHLGLRSVFWIPLGIHVVQIAVILRLRSKSGLIHPAEAQASSTRDEAVPIHPPHPDSGLFRKLGWIANPFAYLAITALVPVIPSLASKHGLNPTWAGIFCSTWFFARLAAFLVLWQWPAWHYRFRWLFGSMLLLIVSFAGILFSTTLSALFGCQILFGLAVGLIYYSSLYYSMDAGDQKGEHGGIHEAAIGAGIFAGPAIGYLALVALPESPRADTWAVSAALCLGAVWLAAAYRRHRSVRITSVPQQNP
ncbi:MAG: hypothetical protein RI897_438 [Verrucomicrobiota bacterium]|jgi:MFS family permease